MRIGGNGLRHCVRLGKIRKIESEFSKIGVRMAQLWPDEVCRKFETKNRFKIQISDYKMEQAGPGGKIPALPMSTGLSTGLSTGVSTCLSTCLSTGSRRPVNLGAPGCTRLGSRLAWRAGSREFRNLRVLI